MSEITLKRINKEDVSPVKFIDVVEDKRPIRGRNIFPEIYANIFYCARKKSGKSCGIYHTIKNCSTRETSVIAFVSTINRDPTWRSIKKMCEDNKIDFTGYASIIDPETKEDILSSIVRTLEQTTGDEKPKEEEEESPMRGRGIILTEEDLPRRNRKPKRPAEQAQKIIFVFDDLSGELHAPSLTYLMKKNRQFKSKVIIASQYFNDVPLQARKQLDYCLLYRGLAKSKGKLEEISHNLDLSVPFETFLGIYNFCTAENYHFCWIDVVNSEFRKDFTHKIELHGGSDDEERDL
jgi:hypothetical protein